MTDQPLPFDVDRLVRLRRVSAVVPAPDGTWVAVVAASVADDGDRYVSDLWKVSLVEPGAGPIRLTHGPSNDTTPRFRADGSLGFVSDRRDAADDDDGQKRRQVWLLPIAGGEPRRLTDEPLGVQDFRFAAAGDRMVVVAPVLPGVPHDEQRQAARERAKKGPSALRYRQMPVRLWDHWIPVAAPHLVAYDGEGQGRRDLTPEAVDEHREVHFDVEWDLSRDGGTAVVTDGAARRRPAPRPRAEDRPDGDRRGDLHRARAVLVAHPAGAGTGRTPRRVRAPRTFARAMRPRAVARLRPRHR